MRILYAILLAAFGLISSLAQSRGVSEDSSSVSAALKSIRVVVSARALQAEGRSHWQLYLYNGNGTLLKQLTHGSGFDNVNPVFSQDGKTISFTRMPAKYQHDLATSVAKKYYFSSRGGVLHEGEPKETTKGKLPRTPINDQFHFRFFPYYEPAAGGTTDTIDAGAWCYPSPDGKYQLVSKNVDVFSERLLLRNSATRSEDYLCSMPVHGEDLPQERYGPNDWVNAVSFDDSPWIAVPPLQTVILWSHLNSTDGQAYFALDASRRCLYELSPNNANVMLIDGVSALFVLCDELYTKIPGGRETANCSYLDIWAPQFQRHRCSPNTSIFGGASIYVPDERGSKGIVYVMPTDLVYPGRLKTD